MPASTITELTTPRLRLRQWRDSDRELFFELCRNPRVMEFLMPVDDRAASDVIMDRWAAHITGHGWGFWAVELREAIAGNSAPVFIGSVGLQIPRHPFPFMPCVEVGWRLFPEHWGKGYAIEAARASIDFGFNRLGLSEIVAITTTPNRRSQAVMQRLGMTPGNPPVFRHPAIPRDHPLNEHVLYRLGAV
ncbi:RimJ/RimL family protein N-acetyltransferase [Ereboglobus sp. PH5-10]|uniref:GNAT family N-acetyltransferase n=1 Tax=Ereboglobus sp. PH5-10 TaxID=2940629 RepID=UPI0024056F13|nr:GNAT family N-acetyltransferase [Ereboglobus sp. PH5-10]MDF9828487.1 RimJ/RimL family protein N-acetyltransferase [Ereboglobus sp. PH5-10]